MKKLLPSISQPLPDNRGWEAYVVEIEDGQSTGRTFCGLRKTEAEALANARKAAADAES